MIPILLLLINADIITGNTLWKRAKHTPKQQSYYAKVMVERDKALDFAWKAAGEGEFRVTHCIDSGAAPSRYSSSADQFRADVVRVLNDINSLTAREHHPTNSYRCIDIDWSLGHYD